MYRGRQAAPSGFNHIFYPEWVANAGVGGTGLPPAGFTREGIAWYVFDGTESKMVGPNIWELFANLSGTGNHMTSVLQNEGGYTESFHIGKVETGTSLNINGFNAGNHLKPIYRYYREWTINGSYYIDHVTGFDGATRSPAVPTGYTLESTPLGYGFPIRFGREVAVHGSAPNPEYIASNASTRVGIIRNWGAGVASIQRWNGSSWVEYVNRCEPGTMLGYATRGSTGGDYGNESYNPTEGGDRWGYGSPASVTINSSTSFSTATIPLMFKSSRTEANQNIPLMYGGVISKTVEVLANVNSASVVRFETTFRPFESRVWTVEAAALHLNAQTMFANNGTGIGYTSLYTTNASNVFTHRAMISETISQLSTTPPNHIRWGELRLDGSYGHPDEGSSGSVPAESNLLLVTHRNSGSNVAAGVLIKNLQHSTSPMVVYNRDLDGTSNYGPLHNMTNNLHPAMRNVNIASGGTYTVRSYILIGTLTQVVSAANTMVASSTY